MSKKKTPMPSNKPNVEDKGVSTKKLVIYLSLVLSAIAFVLYANTLNHDYTVDDGTVMQNNKIVKKGVSALPEIFTTAYRKGFWDRNESLYRPLSVAMFAIEWQLAPGKPALGHWINVLLYSLTAALLFRFLLLLFKQNMMLAFTVTLLFVIHPIHTEVVANIKSRDEILCFLFLILSFHQFILGITTHRMLHYALSSCFLFLSLLSKESSITAVVVFPLIAYFFYGHSIQESLKKIWFPALAGIVYLSIRFMVLKGISNFNDILPINNSIVNATNWMEKVATAVMILGKYIYLLFIPHPLSFDYSYNTFPIVNFSDYRALLSGLVLLIMIYFAIKGFKQRKMYAFGILFFLITISIVSNVFFLIESVMAERFTYMPSLGFCLAVGSLLYHGFNVKYKHDDMISLGKLWSSNRGYMMVVVVLTLMFSVKTIARNNDWKDNLTLLAHDVKVCPESARIRYAYGSAILIEQALKEHNREKKMVLLDKSIEQLQKGVSILPTYSEAFYHLGLAYKERENYAMAVESFERASSNKTFTDPQFFIAWGVACGKAKMYDKCIKALNHAVDLDPQSAEAFLNLGVFYDEMQQFDQALNALNKSMQIDSLSDGVYYNMGNTMAHQGKFNEAITFYKKASAINPTNEDAVNNTGNSYAAMGDYNNAIIYFKKVIELNPTNTKALNNLGVTLMMTGHKEEGRGYIEKAKALGG